MVWSTSTGTRAAAGMKTEPPVQLNAFSRSPKSRVVGGSAIASSSTRQSGRTTPALKPVVDEYKARGVQAEASPEEVIKGLGKVINAARGLPLFLFLDPCGVGIPFSELTGVLSGPRRDRWPPTEVLLNFSLEAVRRIGGHAISETPTEKSMARLDIALGGEWWRDVIREHGVTDDAVEEIVGGFMNRLAKATKMRIVACPVSRAPSHKPVYYLVHGTRKPLGIWYFGDAAARAEQKWWETREVQGAARDEAAGIGALFEISRPSRPDIEKVEDRGAAGYCREHRPAG